jgi:hypothetical protein
MVGRLFNRYKYTSTYNPTHEGIHESLLKYVEEHAGESLDRLKLERLKDIKDSKKTDNSQDKKL